MNIGEASWLRLDRSPRETLRAAVERILREAILGGVLRPGVRLPSSRALAAELGVSRGVTTEAYSQLEAQGFLVSRTKATPVVARIARPRRSAEPLEPALKAPRYDLVSTTPDVKLFPIRQWTSALLEVARTAPSAAFDYGDPRGERELREMLADHLGRTRGIVTDPARILVVQGAAQGIDLLARVLAVRGARRIAVEDPSLDSQPQRIRAHGLKVVGQRTDAEGLVVDGLRADAVLVTPAHQFPTGAVLSGGRRRALLEWANQRRALVIEDDYDAEFRYDRRPVRALQGLDPERVAYLGTTSKSLAPALRLGWLAVPAELAGEAVRIKHLLDVCSPPIDQMALARFIRRGDYDRHVRRARAIYHRRRDRLLAALNAKLPGLAVQGVAAGMHVLLRLPPGVDDRAVACEAERDGVRIIPLSTYRLQPTASDRGGLVIGYGRVHEDEVERAVIALARALRRAGTITARPPPAPAPDDDWTRSGPE
ncbi:MAG TPA: PLP-dependent aminotransferase family protein [Actinomycetes bacterium]|nr:PLP-dependent aminotransferase family protein [Actinomycetes bacterium]